MEAFHQQTAEADLWASSAAAVQAAAALQLEPHDGGDLSSVHDSGVSAVPSVTFAAAPTLIQTNRESMGFVGVGTNLDKRQSWGTAQTLERRRKLKQQDGPWKRAFMEAYGKVNARAKEVRQDSTARLVRASSRLESIMEVEESTFVARQLMKVRGWIKELVLSQAFNMLCGILILANTLVMGAEIEYLTQHEETTTGFGRAQTVFNIWYAFELVLRFVCYGKGFFTAGEGEWRWNVMDLALVSTSLVDIAFASLNLEGMQLGFMLRTVRLMRMLRTLRILRSFRMFSTFRKMVFALSSSMSNLFWSFVMLGLVIYFFAIFLTASVSDCLLHRLVTCAVDDDYKLMELHHKFGSVGNSMFTLYQSIAEGQHWYKAAELLMEVDPLLLSLFLFYIQLSIFGVLNIIEAVFVESAILSTQRCKELLVETKMEEKEGWVRNMRDIFHEIDVDKSGAVTLEELTDFLNDEGLQLQNYLEALDLNPTDTAALFKLLDIDDSGTVDIEEFCDGCMRLKGEARSFDINCILYNIRKMASHISTLRGQVDRMAETLHVARA